VGSVQELVFIPNGGEGNVTVVHQDSAAKYTVVATVPTFAGAKTIAVDPTSPQRVPLSAGARSGSRAPGWRDATGGWTGPRAPGPIVRGVVHRHQAVGSA